MLGWRRSGRINVRRRFRHPVPIDEVSNRCLRTHLDPTFHGIRPWCKVKVGEAVAKSVGVEALEDVGYVSDEVMIFRTITGGTEDARGRIVGCTEGIIRGESRVRVKGDRHDDDERMTNAPNVTAEKEADKGWKNSTSVAGEEA